MSPELCMVVLPEYGAHAPGRDGVAERACRLVDAEVCRIFPTAYAEIEKLLRGNLPRLAAPAQALLEHETLHEDASYAAARIAVRHEPMPAS